MCYSGFIAQEVEATAKQLDYDFSGVDVPQDEGDIYGLRYAEFVVPLVKAVQELSAENKVQANIIAEQQAKIEQLEAQAKRMDKLEVRLNLLEVSKSVSYEQK
ncbi:MAG: hypothetical protein AAF847_14325 [Bacteroidota bacterium]